MLEKSLHTELKVIRLPVKMLATPSQIGELPTFRTFEWFESRVQAMVNQKLLVAASGRMHIVGRRVSLQSADGAWKSSLT